MATDYNSKYSGEQVEALLDQVASGNAGGGGGGGITVETDPIFSASPAAGITEEQIVAWDDLDEMVNLLDADVAQLTKDVMVVQESLTDLDTIRSGAAKGATALQEETYKGTVTGVKVNGETKSPSDGVVDLGSVGTYSKPSTGIPNSDLSEELREKLETAHRNAMAYQGTVTNIIINGVPKSADNGVIDLGNLGTYSKPSTGIPKSDLNPSVQTSLGKADTAVQPADIREEVYIADFTIESLRDGIYNGIDVDCNVQGLVDAMNANKVILVRESEDSSYKGVYVLNGIAEDFLYFSIVDTSGNILWCEGSDYKSLQGIDAQSLHERSWDYKQDTLVSGENIKTINGESILGEGDIEISEGSGEQGPQGEKGDKGDKGDTGTGVQSVKQTTISNTDGGSNVVTVTLTNGTTSTFTVKNGSKGSNGSNGTNGKDGADGATYTPSVDSAGNLSWTNNKGLANPPTVNIKGPKGDAGEGGGGSGGGGKEIVLSQYIHFDDTNPVQPNKIYISSRAMTATYIGAFQEVSNYDEYCIIFKYPEDGVTLPESVKFANGQMSTIEYATECELSVVGIGSGANRTYHAVLTPFKTL